MNTSSTATVTPEAMLADSSITCRRAAETESEINGKFAAAVPKRVVYVNGNR